MNDKEEFCEQIRLYEKAMYNLAFSITKNNADAAEILSETVFRAYKNRCALKNPDLFKGWILKITHNTAVEYIRKNSKTVTFNDLEIISPPHDIGIVNKLSVHQAINQLKQPYRTAVVLYYYEDLSVLQISKITNSTPVAVKQHLARAKKQLRDILKEDLRNG